MQETNVFAEGSGDAARTMVAFCRYARAQGLAGGVQVTLGMLGAALCLGLANRETLRFGLRAAMCSSKDEWDSFDEIFETFFGDPVEAKHSQRLSRRQQRRTIDDSDRNRSTLMSGAVGESQAEDQGSQEVAGASERERLRKADFSTLRQDDLAALETIARRLLRQMSARLSRRHRMTISGGRLDLRRTIHHSISRGGDPIDLRYRKRKPRPNRLVILLDISGSMSPYSLFLMRFVYVLQKHFKQVTAFLFSTDLVEITHLLRAARLADALRSLSQLTTGWSGGTKIGASLSDFNRLHAGKLRRADTVFLILSDGWDTGEPEMLAAELAAVKHRVHKLIWLNPLLGLADYRPITRGMSAALPHVDVFAPAHNLESLMALERHL